MTTASLERVMDGLGESDKYNAVLQGVSSLLMGKKKAGDAAQGAFEEVFQLLDEMHANRIKCTIRTASAVVDAATATTNIVIITQGEAYRRVFRRSVVWVQCVFLLYCCRSFCSATEIAHSHYLLNYLVYNTGTTVVV